MDNKQTGPTYAPGRQVYVVRCWHAGNSGRWYGELADVTGGEVLAFSTMSDMLTYLESELQRPQFRRRGLR